MEKMVGKGHFQRPGGPCRTRPDAPAAGEPQRAEGHGMRLMQPIVGCCGQVMGSKH